MVLTLVAATVALAGPFARSAAIVNGPVVDPAPSWAAAFVGADGEPYCAGVLISPKLVLTAKHCAQESNDRVVIGRSAVQNGGAGEQTGIAHTIDHSQADLAIRVLDRSVNLPPLSIGSGDPSSDPMSFVPFTVYGYGVSNEMTESPLIYDGKLRTAVGLVSTCNSRLDAQAPRFCLKPQSIQAPCKADSGAPLVASNHLIGIFNGFFWTGQKRCVGSDWVATSVTNSSIKKWVNDTIAANPSS
jgi:hypothetical protein